MDGTDCEMAAEELGLLWLSQFDDKTSRSGCFHSPGFSAGVYFNAHPEAPMMDDNETYRSICRLTTPEPTRDPTDECEMACSADLERVERQVTSNTDELSYLTGEVPTVLANTFTTVANLERMVMDLQSEVERLSKMVESHENKFMCLASEE